MELVTSTNIYFERRRKPFVHIRKCMKACGEAGYRQLDFGFPELMAISSQFAGPEWLAEIRDYQTYADSLGLKFVQAHATVFDFCNTTEGYRQAEALFQRSIQGAGILEVPWIVVHPSTGIKGGRTDPDTHRRNVEFFQHYSCFAARQGVGLAVENMWGTTREGAARYCIHPEDLLRLVEDVACENVKICWDAEHGSIEKLNQQTAIRMLGKHLVATHISDEAGENYIHCLPFLGNADWEEILGALAQINYNGTFDFEIQRYLPGMPEELVPAALKFSYQVGSYLLDRLNEMKGKFSHE